MRIYKRKKIMNRNINILENQKLHEIVRIRPLNRAIFTIGVFMLFIIIFNMINVSITNYVQTQNMDENNRNNSVGENNQGTNLNNLFLNNLYVSGTIDPSNSDVYGKGKYITITLNYDSSINTNNPFMNSDATRSIWHGTGNPTIFDFNNIKTSNNVVDQVSSSIQSATWTDYSANSYSYSPTAKSHGLGGGATSVHNAITTQSDGKVVYLQTDAQNWYYLSIYDFENFWTDSVIQSRDNVFVYKVELDYQYYLNSVNVIQLDSINVYATVIDHDGDTIFLENPSGTSPHYATGTLDIANTNLLNQINSGWWLNKITFKFHNPGSGFLDWDSLDCEYLRVRYYYYYGGRIDFNYSEKILNSSSQFSELNSLVIDLEVDVAFRGTTYIYIYNPSASSWNLQQTYTDAYTGFNFVKTITSSFSSYINSSGYIQIRIMEEYSHTLGSTPPSSVNINVDMLDVSWTMTHIETTNYYYFYNFTDINPKYSTEISVSQINGIYPNQIIIPKPEFYILDTIYNSTNDNVTSNPNKLYGNFGDTNLTLTNYASDWNMLGTLQFIFYTENILNGSSLQKIKYIGYNNYPYVLQNLTIHYYDNIFYNISLNQLYYSLNNSIESFIWKIENNIGVDSSDSVALENNNYNFQLWPSKYAGGLYNVTMQTNYTENNETIYIGFYMDINNLYVHEPISFIETYDYQNGYLQYNETTGKFDFSFSIFGADSTTDIAILHYNKRPDTQAPINLVKHTVLDTGSEDIFLTAIYANTSTFVGVDQNNSIYLTFEYFGGSGSANVNITEIAIVPRICDGLNDTYYIYKNNSVGVYTVNNGTLENITITITPQDLLDYSNIGVIPSVYDLIVKFKQEGSTNVSISRINTTIAFFFTGQNDVQIKDIYYLNDTNNIDHNLELNSYTGANGVAMFACNKEFLYNNGFYSPFGPSAPQFSYSIANDSANLYNGIYYFNNQINVTVNASLKPELDIMMNMFYSVYYTNNYSVVRNMSAVSYQYYEWENYILFNILIQANEFKNGNYTIELIVYDYAMINTTTSFNVVIDTTPPQISPYGDPPDFENYDFIYGRDYIRLNITDENLNYTIQIALCTPYELIYSEFVYNNTPFVDIRGINDVAGLFVYAWDLAGNNNSVIYELWIDHDAEPEIFGSIENITGTTLTKLFHPILELYAIDSNLTYGQVCLFKDSELLFTHDIKNISSNEHYYLDLGLLSEGDYYINISFCDIFGLQSSLIIPFNASQNSIKIEASSNSMSYKFYEEEDLILEIIFSANSQGTLSYSRKLINTGIKSTIDIFEINCTSSISSEVIIRIYFDPDRLDKLQVAPESMSIYYYNEESQKWIALNTTLNTEEHYFEAKINHLSLFALGLTPEPPISLMLDWLIVIISLIASVGMVSATYFLYKRTEIKEYREDLKEYKQKIKEKSQTSKSIVDIKKIDDNIDADSKTTIAKPTSTISTVATSIQPITKKETKKQIESDSKSEKITELDQYEEEFFSSEDFDSIIPKTTTQIKTQIPLKSELKQSEITNMENIDEKLNKEKLQDMPKDAIKENISLKSIQPEETSNVAYIQMEADLYHQLIKQFKEKVKLSKEKLRIAEKLKNDGHISNKRYEEIINEESEKINKIIEQEFEPKIIDIKDIIKNKYQKDAKICPICGTSNPMTASYCMKDKIKLIF
ncbi:MAG: hypothetical protein ACTSRZ_14295 [Promethearchaeota archaeon]